MLQPTTRTSYIYVNQAALAKYHFYKNQLNLKYDESDTKKLRKLRFTFT